MFYTLIVTSKEVVRNETIITKFEQRFIIVKDVLGCIGFKMITSLNLPDNTKWFKNLNEIKLFIQDFVYPSHIVPHCYDIIKLEPKFYQCIESDNLLMVELCKMGVNGCESGCKIG